MATKIVFKNKPYTNGGSWVITIPAQYITNGLVNPEKEHKIMMIEMEETK